MRIFDIYKSNLLTGIAFGCFVVIVTALPSVLAVDSLSGSSLGAQALEAAQRELGWWQWFDMSMTVLGNLLLLAGTLLPLVASNGLLENAKPSTKTRIAFVGAAAVAIYGLFHFPEQIRLAREAQSQLEPAITSYNANEDAVKEDKDIARQNKKRRENYAALSQALSSAKNRFLGLTGALSNIPDEVKLSGLSPEASPTPAHD